jgi:uncharacterized membrane protein
MTNPSKSLAAGRIASLDVMRGLVCVLMAIDHVRVYSGVPAGGMPPSVFFTRWITHFVAPGFCFLAGMGAFLQGRKLGDTAALARFLITRGLVLVLLELTLIRFEWTFNFDYAHYVLAGVIWMLGWCMVLLALLVRFSPRTVGIVGLAVVFFQQLFGVLPNLLPAEIRNVIAPFWEFLYPLNTRPAFGIAVLYVIVPWIGVMAVGYGFGTIMLKTPAERRRLCLKIGLSATAIFLIAGGLIAALSPEGDHPRPFIFRLLAQQKYPASQLFLLMTLGPTIALLPSAEAARGWFARMLEAFGRVPMFYYLLHIALIHIAALVVSIIRTGDVTPWLFANHPMAVPPQPDGYRWSLPLLYLVWAVCISLLYPACRWYAAIKARHPRSWFSFI